MPPPSDVVVVLALGGMLAVAFVHPSGRVEALVGLACACITLATGLLTSAEVRASLTSLAPVVAFLVTILVVSDVCARAGLFAAAAQRVGRWSGGKPALLFTGVFVARGRRHRGAEPRRDRRPADAGRPRRRPGPLGAHRARHLRLPADGQLGLAPAAGLQPDQPAGVPAPRPDLHRLRDPDGTGPGRGARRGVRRPAPAVPARADRRTRGRTTTPCNRSRCSRWSSSG